MKVVPTGAGPAAELARLSRPSGPWLHLLDAAPADARQLGWLLGRDGMVVRQLRGACGRSRYGLLDEVGAALQLPGDPVEDWPGLAALLTDMAWLPGAGHVLVVTRASLLLAAAPVAELRGLVDTVRDVARARAEEGDPLPFHLVLQDDSVGLAALRARLDAVPARYVELVGWEATEPAVALGPSARSVLTGGAPDAIDRVAGVAASALPAVRSVGRAWEEFRGGSSGPVRTYVPLLAGPADPVAVAAALAGAVAAAGASCVVVPAPVDPALADARQAAVAAAATEIWPHPPAPADPPTARVPTEPPAGTAAPAELPVETETPGGPPAGTEKPAEPAARPAAPVEPPAGAVEQGGTPVRAVISAVPAGEVAAPVEPPVRTAAPAGLPVVAEPAAGPGTGSADPPSTGPHDRPGAGFELIAANLQWPFDAGSADDDEVDAALLAHASASRRTAALFRTWVQDPDGSWVRVVLGYVDRSPIADVEAERTAVVEALQRSGAARCCVEVVAAADVSDAHRWLEQRCRPLWPRPTPDRFRPEPRATAAAGASEATGSSTASGATGTPAPVADLSADATFRPGPAVDDPAYAPVLRRLVNWAAGTPGVVGLVTAYAGDRLVVGVALDADSDPDRVRADAPAPVEPFAPARGLAPVHLRLSRGSTRIWTRRAERAVPAPVRSSGELRRPEAPRVTGLGPPPVRDTEDARGDERLGDFTLVGIDRDTEIAKGPPDPDGPDAALIAWATAEPTVTALLRARATVADATIPVYTVAVTEGTDPAAARRALATAAGSLGVARAAAEALDPAGALSAFHLDLAVGSTRLWPRPR